MRLLQKILAGFLLLLGVPIVMLGAFELLNPDAQDKEGALAAMILFGLPPTAAGSFLVWNLKQSATKTRQLEEQAQERQFLQLLQETDGKLTPIRLATATGMSLDDAKLYLDEKAQQLNASFEVSEEGGMSYRFYL